MTAARWLVATALMAASAASVSSASSLPDDAVGRLTPDVLPALGPGANWALRPPADAKLVFRGVVDFDHAGFDSSAMLYPAFGLAGFVAALATHGLLVNSAQNSKKQQLQQQADEVVSPYRGVLADFDLRRMAQSALASNELPGHGRVAGTEPGADAGLDWVIDVAPVFSMTQDQSALVLDNVVVVHAGSAEAPAVYRNIVRVVSQPRQEADLAAYWTASQGEALKTESAGLLAQSLDLAMHDMSRAQASDEPQHTQRYLEGHVDRMERAQLIEARCGRRLLRTLRGWLMSVPVVERGCAPAPAADPAASAASAASAL